MAKGYGGTIIPKMKPAYHTCQRVCVCLFVCVGVCVRNNYNMVKNQEIGMANCVLLCFKWALNIHVFVCGCVNVFLSDGRVIITKKQENKDGRECLCIRVCGHVCIYYATIEMCP